MRRRLAGAAIIALASTWPALASVPVTWQHPSASPVEGARSSGIAVDSSGLLSLSHAVREIFPADSGTDAPAIVYSLVADGSGGLYMGGGSPGSIMKLDRKGIASASFSGGELGLRALAVSPKGELFAGTFPEGRVYKIDSKGIASPFAEIEERYIWALLLDPLDNLYIASGERGTIYRATSDGDSSVFFDSAESHVMCLARDAQGGILAGTDPGGLLYRITPDGRATVLMDSDLREIDALALGPDGAVYAAAISEEPARAPKRSDDKNDLKIEVTPTLDTEELMDDTDRPRKISIDLTDLLPPAPAPGEGSASRVYRLLPGRPPEVIWSSDAERVYALAVSGTTLYLGTDGGSSEGRIYEVTGPRRSRLLASVRESQVSSLVVGENGRLFAATANTGRLYVMEPGLAPSGTYTSPVHDAGRSARFGTISWDAEVPPGSRIEVTTRSGNRPGPDDTWSPWSTPVTAQAGQPVPSPPARYIQWKAELSRIKSDISPALRRVSITMLPENAAPRLRQVSVLARGTASASEPPAGQRWITWQSSDPDGDALSHSIWIRKQGDAEFTRLADNVAASPWAFDDKALAEGPYQVKVVADDSGPNGPARGLSDEAVSDGFLVDRTAPKVSIHSGGAAARTGRLQLQADATDAAGGIARGQYHTDASSAWIQVPCLDGICDAPSESFAIELPGDTPAKTITLRVYDTTGNAAEIDIPVPAREGR